MISLNPDEAKQNVSQQFKQYNPVQSETSEALQITDNSLTIEDKIGDDFPAEDKFIGCNAKNKIAIFGIIAICLCLILSMNLLQNVSSQKKENKNQLQTQFKTKSQKINKIETDSSSFKQLAKKEQNQNIFASQKERSAELAQKQIDTTLTNVNDEQIIAKFKQRYQQDNNNPQAHTPFTEHVHFPLTFSYPTMGMPTLDTTFNFTKVLPQHYKEYQAKMDELFKPYNENDCQLERYGDYGDGGYLLCKNYVNNSEALINLGVEGRDSFGCQLTTAFPMPNYQYDCTNNFRTICATNQHGNIFDLGCLGQKSQTKLDRRFYALKDIIDGRNLTHKHVTMKIDIEGAEWPGFRSFPIEYLDYVDQFILQIHNEGRGMLQNSYWGNLDIINSLKERFVSVNLHMNTGSCRFADREWRFYPAFAIQVSLVNKKLIKLKSQSRSYRLNSKNHPNGDGPNCQLFD